MCNFKKRHFENGNICGFGASSPMFWIYENRNEKIRMLADIGAMDDVKVTTQRTSGYYDILLSGHDNSGDGTFRMNIMEMCINSWRRISLPVTGRYFRILWQPLYHLLKPNREAENCILKE